ncbi:MAG TPA: GNAT family N-acetyltransferase [Synergistales bacterium]|mgnify:CR=1 FL=1|nr:GNAT family N-acetyltransferase [Synergistales bacterium]HRV71301.1 GNAT family N-acetyltransferase [Thermovirgaceae bacterium]
MIDKCSDGKAVFSRDNSLFPVITTKRLVLRQLSRDDAPMLHNIWSDPVVLEFMVLDPFETLEEAIAMIELLDGLYETGTGVRWTVTLASDGTVMGTCGYHNWAKEHFRAETGYELGKDFWGKGYMKEAMSAILEFGFKEMDLNRVEALVTDGNERSLSLLKSLGFKVEGLLEEYEWARGKFQDQWICSLLRSRESEKPNSSA